MSAQGGQIFFSTGGHFFLDIHTDIEDKELYISLYNNTAAEIIFLKAKSVEEEYRNSQTN